LFFFSIFPLSLFSFLHINCILLNNYQMNYPKTIRTIVVVTLFCLMTMTMALAGDSDELPQWQPPSVQEVRTKAFTWLDRQGADEPARAAAKKLWSNLPDEPTDAELLECLAGTFALVDQHAAALVELCSKPRRRPTLPNHDWLIDDKTPPLVAANMRLFYGRWLAHRSLFDESLEQLAGLQPDEVVAPAMLLFYQGVVYHSLLDKESGLAALRRLLAGAESSPRRYVAVARLVQHDLEMLKADTLDHISRRMDDIRRRLDLGRAGKKVMQIEDGVIASLDKLIKKLEDEQSKCSCSSGGNIQSSKPAQDSRLLGGKGRGNVTRRSFQGEADWGDLPPKQREETLQQIGRDFPAHYRDIIEQYFRRLATDGGR
jgi:hypothetical protein